jgi:ABC-type transport system involved in multi-copper enzyme maturation permease subunit
MNDSTTGRSPAQYYALVFGATLVVAGIIGFFYSASFGSPGKVDGVLGILDVNGWHNIVHIATGALGLLALSYSASRTYALGLGIVYVAVTIWGFAVGDGGQILGILPVNTEDNILHLLIGLIGLGAYAATPAAVKPTTARRSDAHGAAA